MAATAFEEGEKENKENVSGRGSKKEKTSLSHRQQKGTEETKTTLSALTAAVTGWLLF